MAIQLPPTRVKGSKYLLIPKDLAQLLEIDDGSVLNLTIEDTEKGSDWSILSDRNLATQSETNRT